MENGHLIVIINPDSAEIWGFRYRFTLGVGTLKIMASTGVFVRVVCALEDSISFDPQIPSTIFHGPRRGNVAALPPRGGGTGSLLAAQNVFTVVTSKQAFEGGAPSREDLRRKKSSMRAEVLAGLEKFFTRAARRSTEPVSLQHLLSHSGLEKKARRTASRWTNH
jgi:hypothetical protein